MLFSREFFGLVMFGLLVALAFTGWCCCGLCCSCYLLAKIAKENQQHPLPSPSYDQPNAFSRYSQERVPRVPTTRAPSAVSLRRRSRILATSMSQKMEDVIRHNSIPGIPV
ncbi:hypothetical protein KIN20_018603 [Parelaphostrongylus tenuis]|uniref:Uncharacterized protein n=1 Tax=Parelaphostrongylus tenuis TaxID=148309 RepID=A0AAD5QRM5_PARTN|nr:hypothetical protein KIN20_018603 [Parelaphostrongylus tenuis]